MLPLGRCAGHQSLHLGHNLERRSELHAHRIDQVVLLEQQQCLAVNFLDEEVLGVIAAPGKVPNEFAHFVDGPLHNDGGVFGWSHGRCHRNSCRARFHRCGRKLGRMNRRRTRFHRFHTLELNVGRRNRIYAGGRDRRAVFQHTVPGAGGTCLGHSSVVRRRCDPVGGVLFGCTGTIDAAEAFPLHLAAQFRFAANLAVAHVRSTGGLGRLERTLLATVIW